MTTMKQETSAKREKRLKSAFVRLKEQVSIVSSNGKDLSMKKLKKVKKGIERNIADLSCLLSPPGKYTQIISLKLKSSLKIVLLFK